MSCITFKYLVVLSFHLQLEWLDLFYIKLVYVPLIFSYSTFTIVDDDVDMKAMAPSSDKQDDINNPLIDDETPLVADIIDDRPKEEVLLEQFRTSNRWKQMGKDDQTNKREDSYDDLSPRRRTNPGRTGTRHDSSESDLSPPRKSTPSKASRRHDTDSDASPPRRRAPSDPDPSPPIRHRPESSRGRGHISDAHRRQRTSRPSESSASDLSSVRSNKSRSSPPPRKSHGRGRSNSPAVSRERGNSRHSKSKSRNRESKDSPRMTSRRHSQGSDLYPPKSKNRRSDSISKFEEPPRQRNDTDSDLSPVRREESNAIALAKMGHARRDSDSDLSPPRRGQDRRGDTRSDRPPARQHARHDSDSDLSPPRRGQDIRGDTRGDKPPARQHARHDSDSDLSPPRRGQDRRGNTRGDKPPVRPARHDSDADLSPPRRGHDRRGDKRGNNAPVARTRHDSDSSPPRQRLGQDSDSDFSPVRRGNSRSDVNGKGRGKLGADMSPRREKGIDEARKSRDETTRDKRPEITLSGEYFFSSFSYLALKSEISALYREITFLKMQWQNYKT